MKAPAGGTNGPAEESTVKEEEVKEVA